MPWPTSVERQSSYWNKIYSCNFLALTNKQGRRGNYRFRCAYIKKVWFTVIRNSSTSTFLPTLNPYLLPVKTILGSRYYFGIIFCCLNASEGVSGNGNTFHAIWGLNTIPLSGQCTVGQSLQRQSIDAHIFYTYRISGQQSSWKELYGSHNVLTRSWSGPIVTCLWVGRC